MVQLGPGDPRCEQEVRLNTYSDSVGTAGVLTFQPSNPRQPASATIKRRSAVQKLTSVHPATLHSKRRRLPSHGPFPADGRLQFLADLALGRMLQNQFISNSELCWTMRAPGCILALLQTEDRATQGCDL